MPEPITPVTPVVPVAVAPVTPIVAPVANPFGELTADQKGIVEHKGWGTPADMLNSYTNLEKMASDKLGASPDTLIKKPMEGDAKSLADFRVALGVPTEAKDYDYGLPEGSDTSLTDVLSPILHEHNVPANAAKALAEGYTTAVTEAQTKQFEADKALIASEWGGEDSGTYETNLNIAKNTAKSAGYDTEEKLIALQSKMGEGEMVRMFHKLGTMNVNIDPNKGGSALTSSSSSASSAKAQLAELKMDSKFWQSYIMGDAGAQSRVSNLYKQMEPSKGNQ